MKGLIIKDILNLRAQMKVYIMLLVMWFVIGMMIKDAGFFTNIMVMFAIVIPVSSLAYDEKTRWDSFAVTMPISRRDIVTAKYIFSCCAMGAIALITFIGTVTIIRHMIYAAAETIISALPVGLVINAVLIPMIYKFGMEKGRIIFISAILAATGILVFVFKNGYAGVLGQISPVVFGLLLWGAALIFTVISMFISYSIYENKDF